MHFEEHKVTVINCIPQSRPHPLPAGLNSAHIVCAATHGEKVFLYMRDGILVKFDLQELSFTEFVDCVHSIEVSENWPHFAFNKEQIIFWQTQFDLKKMDMLLLGGYHVYSSGENDQNINIQLDDEPPLSFTRG